MRLAASLRSVQPMTITGQIDVEQLQQQDADVVAVEEFAAKLVETMTGGLITSHRHRPPHSVVRTGHRWPGDISRARRARRAPGAVRP
jgi:hypothetical protein